LDNPKVAPYGSWKSLLTTDLMVSETIRLDQVTVRGDAVYWLEGRPKEQGRYVIVRRTLPGRSSSETAPSVEITPAPFNVRSRVQEYGGGAYLTVEGAVIFSHYADNRLYRQRPEEAAEPFTPHDGRRYADMVFDARRNRLICVCEAHAEGGGDPLTSLVSIALDGSGEIRTLASGRDFYAAPRLSPEGDRLAWLCWDHPNMPWDGTELWVGQVGAEGCIEQAERVEGGPEESIFQPEWSPDGLLYFISDRTGWWNLYRRIEDRTEPLWAKEAEFGMPLWVFGMSTYAFESPTGLVCTYMAEGVWHLAHLDTVTLGVTEIPIPYTHLQSVRAIPGQAVLLAGSPTEPASVIAVDLTTLEHTVLRRSSTLTLDPASLSIPESITFPTTDGQTAYALYYPPTNPEFRAPEGERPPLIVASHGGPTAAARNQLEFSLNSPQFWTSRGFAFVDVNYGGSTGYGRAYRERLNGQWGIVDRDDCAAAARFLAARGAVDPQRMAIRGGSAGGYTTLCALTFLDCFQAGASYFGVCDLEALARDTHKFESRYMERLVGPYPERADLYRERSPIHYVERLTCPVIFFQGLEDRVVPPNQAEMMFEALRTRGVPTAYIPFEGEGHGFVRAESIQRSLKAELAFYARLFGFTPADPLEPLAIENSIN